jgi:L-alanine-DL-glutamate epimerase-like enolase superfamily enzyme
LRIERIDVFGVQLTPVGGAFRLSRGRVMGAERSLLVRVSTDAGVEGWGEACPLTSAYLPAFRGGVEAALAELTPALVGADPCNLADVHARMDATLLGQHAAKSPLDMACWDVLGRTAGVPLVTLLGGRATERLPLYAAIPMGAPEETERHVREALGRGLHRFQVKVGGDPRADAAAVRLVLKLAGDGALVVADANGGWSLGDALVAVRLLEPLPIHLEQPCRSFADCVHVRRATTLPMVYDESVVDADSLVAAVRQGGASAVNLKLGKLGGLARARQLRDLALALGASVTIEDTWGGDVATAAVSHLAASTLPDGLLSVSFLNDAVAEHVAGHEPRSRGGEGSAPVGPGLGIDVDASGFGPPLLSTALR